MWSPRVSCGTTERAGLQPEPRRAGPATCGHPESPVGQQRGRGYSKNHAEQDQPPVVTQSLLWDNREGGVTARTTPSRTSHVWSPRVSCGTTEREGLQQEPRRAEPATCGHPESPVGQQRGRGYSKNHAEQDQPRVVTQSLLWNNREGGVTARTTPSRTSHVWSPRVSCGTTEREGLQQEPRRAGPATCGHPESPVEQQRGRGYSKNHAEQDQPRVVTQSLLWNNREGGVTARTTPSRTSHVWSPRVSCGTTERAGEVQHVGVENQTSGSALRPEYSCVEM